MAPFLKPTTQAGNRWLGEKLFMGRPVAVSQYVSALVKTAGPVQDLFKHLTERLKICPLFLTC
jgi:hypothetical protein